MLQRFARSIIASALILGLSGCFPAAVVTTAKVGTTIAEERTAGSVVDDAVITSTIKQRYAEHDLKHLLMKISVDTTEGRVLLTGSLDTHDQVMQAVKLAWSVEGVKEVLNELEVANKTLQARANDRWIATQIRTKILFDRDVRSVNYTVDVNNGVVFLVGIAQNQQELNEVINTARKVRGVKKVVSHVALKNDPRRVE